jgi:LacI family transcriptional regulator
LVNGLTVPRKEARRPTLQDVADAAAVSIATASYVLSGRSDRSRPAPEATRARVQAAAAALGYHANQSARVLRRQRTEVVAIAYQPPVGPWIDRLTIQTEDFAATRSYSVIGIPVRRAVNFERSLTAVYRGYVDGIIFAGFEPHGLDFEAMGRATRAIVMFGDGDEDYGPRVDTVYNNAEGSLRDATRHLIEQGRRRIAFLSHDLELEDHARYRGYRAAITEAGLALDPSLIRPGAGEYEDALLALRDLLGSPTRPDAIVSESDRGALIALRVAGELGLSVPADLAVIGVGNTREGELSSPALTSVGLPTLDFTPVIEALFSRIDDIERPAVKLPMPWVLNRRESA